MIERALVAAAVVVPALVFLPVLDDPFNLPKLTTLGWIAAGVLVLWTVELARGRPFCWPPPILAGAVLAFLAVAAASATLVASHPARAVAGAQGRSSGLAMYVVCGVMALAAGRALRGQAPRVLLRALVVAAVPIVVYSSAQLGGWEPMNWRVVIGGPQNFSTFGNANFYAGWMGTVLVAAAWGTKTRTWSMAWRVLSGLVCLLGVVTVVWSDSLQGSLAAVAGLLLVLSVRISDPESRLHRARWVIVWSALAAGGVLLVLVLAGVGPFGALGEAAAGSFQTRRWQWAAAIGMAIDRPFTGVGFDAFVDFVHAYRPLWSGIERGVHPTTNAAHSVPLHLLAGGGIPLLLAWLAVMALPGVALVRGLRGAGGERRLLLGALGGIWVAYLAQSLVSIDVPPLAVLGWVVVGALVASGGAADPARRRPVADPGTARRRPVADPGTARRRPVAAAVNAGLAAVLALGVTIPALAGFEAGRARRLAFSDEDASDRLLERAGERAWWEPAYLLDLGRRRSERSEVDAALEAYRTAVTRQPRGIVQVVELARLAARADEPGLATAMYARALEIDPRTPSLQAEAGRWRLLAGDAEGAAELLAGALEAQPTVASWWRDLADAADELGDAETAARARARSRSDDVSDPPEEALQQPAP